MPPGESKRPTLGAQVIVSEDLEELRRLVPKGMLLVAKIEKDSALARIDEITDGLPFVPASLRTHLDRLLTDGPPNPPVDVGV